jgi:hypothetical protein
VNRNKAARYLPFDALKGLKESIGVIDDSKNKIEKPNFGEDELYDMDVTMMRCYGNRSIVTIEYISSGVKESKSGVIEKIDLVDKALFIHPKKKIYIKDIIGITEHD